MSKETGGYAFPQHTLEPNPNGGEPRIIWQEGMTLRDYIAIHAMQGMLAACTGWSEAQQERLAKCSYSMADQVLKAREL